MVFLMLLFSWLFTTNCGVNNLSTLKTSKIPEGSGQKHLNLIEALLTVH